MREGKRILVIEDDADIARMLALNLQSEGFETVLAGSGEAGIACLADGHFNLMILDLMLPGMDGLQVCRAVRTRPEYLPVIIVSARSSETHRVLGLELGADDYLAKPFSMTELVARARAVLRRMDAAEELAASRAGVMRRGALTIDPVAREARLEGREMTLTSKEFDLLAFFARHAGRVFRRQELLDQVWGYTHDGYEHTVNSHINRLRAKIESDPSRPKYILTVRGVGYRMVVPDEMAAGANIDAESAP